MATQPTLSALTKAQTGSTFTPEIQTAAKALNLDILKTALDTVLAGDDSASVDGDQAATLKAGFEAVTKLVTMLGDEPKAEEKLDLYKYFKQARGEQPAQPSFYQMEAKYKYNSWKEISHISAAKAQARYIEVVGGLIEKYGTREG